MRPAGAHPHTINSKVDVTHRPFIVVLDQAEMFKPARWVQAGALGRGLQTTPLGVRSYYAAAARQ